MRQYAHFEGAYSCVYIKGKPNKQGIQMFEFCDAKSGYVYSLEAYTVGHPINSGHNMVFNDVDRLCDKTKKGRGYSKYKDRWLVLQYKNYRPLMGL